MLQQGVRSTVHIVGAGLSGMLLAARLRAKQVPLRIYDTRSWLACQTDERTWSFHHSDVPEALSTWLMPLVSHTWPGQAVDLGATKISFREPYYEIHCFDFYQKLSFLEEFFVQGSPEGDHGYLIDARGAELCHRAGAQKFFGQRLRLKHPHGLTVPMLMHIDPRMPTVPGIVMEFAYILPFSSHEALIEITHYAQNAALDLVLLQRRLAMYLALGCYEVDEILGQESGSLPLPLTAWKPSLLPGSIGFGVRGRLFHPTTGYSTPYILRALEPLAEALAKKQSSHACRAVVRQASSGRWFFYFLNRLLFLATRHREADGIFRQFFSRSPVLIARFYAGRLTFKDHISMFVGRPPISIVRALFYGGRFW